MKFLAVKDIGQVITKDKIYSGSIVMETEERNDKVDSRIRIVVFNNAGSWSSYAPSSFTPYED